ncbi:hypothetical protein [Derxia gummosa]|uniref:Uncharacterized protein n=1 Tax=Derxia gummosa DSM 723 TaxID=1121388 RepID=A0A8B6XCI6_9BURK|nr:hypothetical protein [Derxia gummosa]
METLKSLLDTQDAGAVAEFLDELKNLRTVDVREIGEFRSANEYAFKLALIHEGLFAHKWSDSLGQYLAIRYQLNEQGKKTIGNNELKEMGFDIDSATISRRYFRFEYSSECTDKISNMVKNYGIETHLGHWIPKNIARSLNESSDAQNFKKELETALYEQHIEIESSIEHDLRALSDLNVIEQPETPPFHSFKAKCEKLLANDLKLGRILSKYEFFDLPYDISNKERIEDLFDEMLALSNSRHRKNVTQHAFLSATEKASPKIIREVMTNALNKKLHQDQ